MRRDSILDEDRLSVGMQWRAHTSNGVISLVLGANSTISVSVVSGHGVLGEEGEGLFEDWGKTCQHEYETNHTTLESRWKEIASNPPGRSKRFQKKTIERVVQRQRPAIHTRRTTKLYFLSVELIPHTITLDADRTEMLSTNHSNYDY